MFSVVLMHISMHDLCILVKTECSGRANGVHQCPGGGARDWRKPDVRQERLPVSCGCSTAYELRSPPYTASNSQRQKHSAERNPLSSNRLRCHTRGSLSFFRPLRPP